MLLGGAWQCAACPMLAIRISLESADFSSDINLGPGSVRLKESAWYAQSNNKSALAPANLYIASPLHLTIYAFVSVCESDQVLIA